MKILICDDHKIVRIGIRHLLQQLKGVISIDEAENGNEALAFLKSNDINIVLLDITLPGISGLEVLQIIKTKWKTINVLMLSMHPQEQYAIRALKLGASGYLTKDTASEELLLAVKKIAAGGKYISMALADNLAAYIDNESNTYKHDILSKREFEIMIKLANGKSLLEIGNELFISNKTVSTYRTRIMEKMELTKNTELTKYCLLNELI
ncbi:MAG: response regulator transcription factor [Prolixibacteraceae bacterium]|jgi:two-component system, NarL family, invasion response regulator UvrY|nr:response regulator transcription factor [Prolixibacteraceae bacterium]MBT4968645.1 response regulator transcription factor [Bacteroidota bacterium]MBT6998845.1 response regulator transcription factor [Prolixibacteraceae bacterium]